MIIIVQGYLTSFPATQCTCRRSLCWRTVDFLLTMQRSMHFAVAYCTMQRTQCIANKMPLKTVFNNNYFINKKNFVLTNKKTRKGRPFKKTGTCFLSIKIIYRPEKSRETIPLSHTVLAVYIVNSAGCLTPLNVLTIKFCGSFLCLLQN